MWGSGDFPCDVGAGSEPVASCGDACSLSGAAEGSFVPAFGLGELVEGGGSDGSLCSVEGFSEPHGALLDVGDLAAHPRSRSVNSVDVLVGNIVY